MATIDERAHANLADFLRWLPALEPDANVLDADGVMALALPTDWPAERTALRTGTELTATEWVGRVTEFFARHGRSACIFNRVGEDDEVAALLEGRGFTEYGNAPEMVCTERLSDPEPGPGVVLRLAESATDVEAYAAIAAKAFTELGMLEESVRHALDTPDAILVPEVAVSLAELDGTPVAGALSVLVGDEPNGYVAWVSCLPEGRGRGLGDLVTRLVTNEAFDRGAQLVTLEASRFGEGTYRRMGYEERYRYRMLIKV